MKLTRIILGVISIVVLCLVTTCTKSGGTGSIRGVVSGASSNQPIEGAKLTLNPNGFSFVTGSDGKYEFNGLNEGDYTIQAEKENYETLVKDVVVHADQETYCKLKLMKGSAGYTLDVSNIDFGSNKSYFNFTITNNTSAPLVWSIPQGFDWLLVTPNSGIIGAGEQVEIQMNIDREKIPQSISTNLMLNIADQTVSLPVNVIVPGTDTPQLLVSENCMVFSGSVKCLQFFVSNTGPSNTSMSWMCTSDFEDWLTLEPMSGVLDGGQSIPVTATIDPTKFDGRVSTSFSIYGAGETATMSVYATFGGIGEAILHVSEGSLDFGMDKSTMFFELSNVGTTSETLNWSIFFQSAPWLSITPMSGDIAEGASATVTAEVDRSMIDGSVSAPVYVYCSNNFKTLYVSVTNPRPIIEVSPLSIDFGGNSNTETLTIRNAGPEHSKLNWHIDTSPYEWLTASADSGILNNNVSSSIALFVDRSKFEGLVTADLVIASNDHDVVVHITASSLGPVMELPVTTVDVGDIFSQTTFEIRNVGEPGSQLHWNIAPSPVEWLTVSPMSGIAKVDSSSVVTVTVDRLAFVGEESVDLTITGGGSTVTANIRVDNTILVNYHLSKFFSFDGEEIVCHEGISHGENHGVVFSDDTPSGQGHSLQFDGDSSYVYFQFCQIPTSNPYSINFWFKTGKNNQTFFGMEEYTNYGPRYRMGITPDACVFLQLDNYHEWTSTNPITAYVNYQWHMLTFTYDEDCRAKYYIDGRLLETVTAEGLNWNFYLRGFYFGKHLHTGVYDGKLDNFRSYHRVLTEDEINALYHFKQ